MRLRCVLFDFDGVLLDSEEGSFLFFQTAMRHFGVAIPDDDKSRYIGMNFRLCAEDVVRRFGLPLTVDELLAQKQRLGSYYAAADRLEPIEGSVAFLRWLRKQGVKTALVSSSSAAGVLTALNRMGMAALFDAIVCGDMVEQPKPEPESYLKAMEWLDARPEQCLIFEDSPIGIRAGKASGARVVAFKGAAVRQDTGTADAEVKAWGDCMEPGRLQALLDGRRESK